MTERDGKPLVCALTAGQQHESPQAIPLLEQRLKRMWPDAVAGDNGYHAHELREWLDEREIEVVIPVRDNEQAQDYDHDAYRERPIVERTRNWRKRYRRIATRYDTRASSYLAMVTVACVLEWL